MKELVFSILYVLLACGMAWGCYVTEGTGAAWAFGIGAVACLLFAALIRV